MKGDVPPARERKAMIGGFPLMKEEKSFSRHVPVPCDLVQTPNPLKDGGLLGERGVRGAVRHRDPPAFEADGNLIGKKSDNTTHK